MPDLRLPYIGINVARLRETVADACTRDRWSRTELYERWSGAYDVSSKTAKEYVSSLANLGVFVRRGPHVERGAETEDDDALLRLFVDQGSWSAFLSYTSRHNAAIELLRALYARDSEKLATAKHAAVSAHLQEAVRSAGISGTTRPRSFEAFTRILRLAHKEGEQAQPARLHVETLPRRLRRQVESLDAHSRSLLDALLACATTLAATRPFYAQVPVFDVSDIHALMIERGLPSWQSGLYRLRDRNLLTLHRTVPDAAERLGVMTIPDGAGVASALSFPRSLHRAVVAGG